MPCAPACTAELISGAAYFIKASGRAGCEPYLAAPSRNPIDAPKLSNFVPDHQQWRFTPVPGTSNIYYISPVGEGCSSYLSFQACGGSNAVDLWGAAGSNQQWQLVPVPNASESNQYYIRSVVRAGGCPAYITVQSCGGNDREDFWGEAGINQAFVISG